jgi:hypothetical protein
MSRRALLTSEGISKAACQRCISAKTQLKLYSVANDNRSVATYVCGGGSLLKLSVLLLECAISLVIEKNLQFLSVLLQRIR